MKTEIYYTECTADNIINRLVALSAEYTSLNCRRLCISEMPDNSFFVLINFDVIRDSSFNCEFKSIRFYYREFAQRFINGLLPYVVKYSIITPDIINCNKS